MTSAIEKSIARFLSCRQELEAKLDAVSNLPRQRSAFADLGPDPDINDLMSAATLDNVAAAAARLRTLHDPVEVSQAGQNPFGKPTAPVVIDAEFTEVKKEPPDVTS